MLFTEHDDAWLNGPGAQTLGWLKNGNEIYFESEKSGYAHLYKVGFDGGEPKQLTSGKFEVSVGGAVERRFEILYDHQRSRSRRATLLFDERRRRRADADHQGSRKPSRGALAR